MPDDRERIFDLDGTDTSADADKWVEGLIMGAMQNIVPDIGPTQTCLALYQAIVAVASHTGADPDLFQHQMLKQCGHIASQIRRIRLAQAGQRGLVKHDRKLDS